MARIAALLTVFALLVPVHAALAQTDPFGPIPATPTPEDSNTSVLGQDVGRSTLYVIAGGFFVAFIGIGWWISRDARRSIVREHPEEPVRGPDPKERGRQRERAKAQARARTKRQKAARKAHRKRR
jgi:hypothetical protein